ncbi:hypothetical protein PBY51_009224 [Eleginops maclovinus]|uniref:Uncharacterized protein n=1 Tax=Eleginops maclovinus TaxID=56733 RepID=A0AAN7XQY9_ELEMC|nr:hypothetical protein PBY51_009224 [Eleginops maclovinus]
MIRWMNSSLLGAAHEDMAVFECESGEGCHCLEGCYGELLGDCVFQQGTASNSNKSTPACSPVLRKRSRSPTPHSPEGENMVEKGSDHSSDKSPSTPEQVVQRTYSLQSARSGGKNSKVSDQVKLRITCYTPPTPPPPPHPTVTSHL